MKKIISVILLLFALCAAYSPTAAKGKIGDQDLYETYIGKTVSTVKKFAPKYQDYGSNLVLADVYHKKDVEINLLLEIEKNKVGRVFLMTPMDSGSIKKKEAEKMLRSYMLLLGLNCADIEVEDNWLYGIDTTNKVNCAFTPNDLVFMISCKNY